MDFTVEDQDVDSGIKKLTIKRKKTNSSTKSKKVKIEVSESPKTDTKLSKAELFKPPTVEELNQLRETEILFNSNLFRLQTEELLKEISLKEKRIKLIKTWVENLKESLENIPENIELKLSDIDTVLGECSDSKLKKRVKEVMEYNPTRIKTDQDCTVNLLKPKSVEIVGLFNVNAISKPVVDVNLNIIAPKTCFLERDYMNSRYLVKRSLYLSYITSYLKKTDLTEDMSYSYLNGNVLIPVLQIKPKDIKNTVVNIRIISEQNTFKSSKFLPEKKNLRSAYVNSVFSTKSDEEYSTPLYNSVILSDLTIQENDKFRSDVISDLKGVCDGIILLKVWLEQRGLYKGYGGFNEELLYSCVAYLVKCGKLNKHMSSYQVIRNVWTHIANSTWDTNGISLSDSPYDIEIFHKYFAVVFIDRTGNYNLAADLDLDIYLKLKYEARLAIAYLDDGKFNSFQSLFITKMPFYLQYDAVINIHNDDKLINLYKTIEMEKKVDHFYFHYPLISRKIISDLKEGLSDRVTHLVPLMHTDLSWKIGESVNTYNLPITIGVSLNHFNLFKVIEKGPPTYDPSAPRFREFWGDRAELRRFKDGSITEAVYWPAETLQDKRRIFKDIINYVLESKLSLKKFNILSDQFDSILRMYPYSGLEEANLQIINLFGELGKLLRALKLPLNITGVQGISDAFSYSDAFPPYPANYIGGKKITFNTENNIMLKESHMFGMVPRYVCPIEGVIQMALHSKWPNSYQALCSLKTAFYIAMHKLLENDHKIKSNPKPEYIDILYNGLVFRLTIFHPKEIVELKKMTDDVGLTSFEDNEESILAEQKYMLLPKLMGALNGLHAQYPSFGPSTALIKRWLNSQLIDDSHVPNVIINLLNASLYMNSAPFTQSAIPQLAFFRFLHMLSNYDWTLQPIILNFNNEITKDQLDEHESEFHRNRLQFSYLHIVTPYDNFKSILTKYVPTRVILNRLKILATEFICVIEKDINSQNLFDTMAFMKPNLEGYNVLIHLKPLLNPRRHQDINGPGDDQHKLNIKPYEKNDKDKIPVIDFNPVDLYLNELKRNYGEFALFFHNAYGGNVIAVIWKPSVYEIEEFKVSLIAGKMLTEGNRIKVNIDAIIEDFYILGDGLVRTIETK